MTKKLSKLEFEEIKSQEENSIRRSKAFERLQEKTQVMVAEVGRDDIVKNRGSHSAEVGMSARSMLIRIAKDLGVDSIYDIDYQYSLEQSCLLHDIGHPPFGHDGAKMIDSYVRAKGLKEGFDDNNNNIVVIESNNIKVRDKIVADIIKYPHKLYNKQKEKYLPVLERELSNDKEHFKKLGVNLKDQKRTITCQIMDEADRNTYTCDDMSDFFRLQDKDYKIKITDMFEFIDKNNETQLRLASEMVEAVNSKSKTRVRKFFNELKDSFNDNCVLNENGIEAKNIDLLNFREALSDITFEWYIKPLRDQDFHLDNIKKMDMVLNSAFDGEYKESKHYNNKIKSAKNKEDILRACRDMVAEVSDHFVMNWVKNKINLDFENIKSKDIKNRKP